MGGYPGVNKLKTFVEQHPRLATWLVLAIGMSGILLWAAPIGELALGQLVILLLAVILLAGACAWILSWE